MAHWIVFGNDNVGYSVRCSSCGEDFGDMRDLTKYWHCPCCGKKMDNEDDEKEGEDT